MALNRASASMGFTYINNTVMNIFAPMSNEPLQETFLEVQLLDSM